MKKVLLSLLIFAGVFLIVALVTHPNWPRFLFRNDWQEIDGRIYLLSAYADMKWKLTNVVAVSVATALMVLAAFGMAQRRQ